MTSPSPLEQQLIGLGTLWQLARKARHAADTGGFAFLVVNETLQLLRYDQAILFRQTGEGKARTEAVSGVERAARDAPYMTWAQELAEHLLRTPGGGEAMVRAESLPARLQRDWSAWGQRALLWMPLKTTQGRVLGGLLLSRGKPAWEEGEAALLEMLADAYGHAWEALTQRGQGGAATGLTTGGWRRWRGWGLAAGLALALGWQVPLSVLAPAQVAPLHPLIVSAPLDGVIQQVMVTPNQAVHQGELLFSLEETTLRNRLDVARKTLEVSRAQLRRGNQQAFGDDRSRGDLMLLQAQVEEKEIEVAFTEEQLARARVVAPRDGVALFTGVNEWLGKPVVTGEKVMTLSNPEESGLEIFLPVSDAIPLEKGAEVALFLNASPGAPVTARLQEIGYQARLMPDGMLAYPLRATFLPGTPPPRLGMRGIAKLHDGKVSLLYYLFRRPLASLRQTTGW